MTATQAPSEGCDNYTHGNCESHGCAPCGQCVTAPTPEQVDAVARALCPPAFDYRWNTSTAAVTARDTADAFASDLLTTTDPTAQAALAASLPAEVMLAALVERGTLTPLPRRGDLPGWRGFTGWVAP